MSNYRANVILITGLPATGKSALADRIGKFAQVPVYKKDIFKEMAYNILEPASREESRRIGIFAEELLLQIAFQSMEMSVPAIVESTFRPKHIRSWLKKIHSLNSALTVVVLQTQRDTLVERFVQRARERSEAHFDSEYKSTLEKEEDISPLEWLPYVSQVHQYDTTHLNDELLLQITLDVVNKCY